MLHCIIWIFMQLGQTYINEISHLSPSPSFVPWVVVNNQPVGKVSTFFSYSYFLIHQHLWSLDYWEYTHQWVLFVSSGLCKFYTLCLQGLRRSCCSRGLQISLKWMLLRNKISYLIIQCVLVQKKAHWLCIKCYIYNS